VVQVITAEVLAMLPDATALITGIDAGVVKVKFADEAVPAESVERTA
jgi:hypothetical protein